MERRTPVAVVLFQLGGPDSLEAIEPFLYNLFSDPDIIDFPFSRFARSPLAKLIAASRARKVQEHYSQIGGKSPILDNTLAQACALEKHLADQLDARVFVAMRYWHPLTESVVRELEKGNFKTIVLLPLYPQYSKTTTGSSLNEWTRRVSTSPVRQLTVKVIKQFYTSPLYLDAIVEKVGDSLNGLTGNWKETHLVFSAHGIPLSVVQAGDPYQSQIEATVDLIMRRGGWSLPWTLCYQSKVGASRWLQPSLHETLKHLASTGVEQVFVVPISFVSDHVETLNEINIEARKQARALGIRNFVMVAGLNDSPKFISALADLVLEAVGVEPCNDLETAVCSPLASL